MAKSVEYKLPHTILLVFMSVAVKNLHCVTCDCLKPHSARFRPSFLLLDQNFPLTAPNLDRSILFKVRDKNVMPWKGAVLSLELSVFH